MYFSDIIKLRSIAHSTDSDGYPTQTPTSETTWANVKSAKRSEFYAANANGIDVSIVFEVHLEDFSDQTEVEYNTKIYDVQRTYKTGLGTVELTCSDKAV